MAGTFLEKVYGAKSPQETRALYDAWSPSYESDLVENGYATPARAAKALAQYLPDQGAPILDFGCGTGLCGQAFKHAGFRVIDGCDVSEEMLSLAGDKVLYRNLDLVAPNTPPDFLPGTYAAITAVGVLVAGAAPISLLDMLMTKLVKGNKLVFSFCDHARKQRGTMARVHEQLDTGNATLLHAKHGAHLPGIDLKSTVYILEKN